MKPHEIVLDIYIGTSKHAYTSFVHIIEHDALLISEHVQHYYAAAL